MRRPMGPSALKSLSLCCLGDGGSSLGHPGGPQGPGAPSGPIPRAFCALCLAGVQAAGFGLRDGHLLGLLGRCMPTAPPPGQAALRRRVDPDQAGGRCPGPRTTAQRAGTLILQDGLSFQRSLAACYCTLHVVSVAWSPKAAAVGQLLDGAAEAAHSRPSCRATGSRASELLLVPARSPGATSCLSGLCTSSHWSGH